MPSVKLLPRRGAVMIAQPRPVPTEWRLKDGTMYSHRDRTETFWLEKSARRMIHGIASTGTVNSHNYSLDPKGCRVKLPVPLLSSHGHEKGTRDPAYRNLGEAAVGEVFYVRRTDDYVYIRALIHDSIAGDALWGPILSGKTRCFSGAADRDLTLGGVVNGAKFFSHWSLKEVSVCPQGANPDCFFDIWHGTEDVQDLTRLQA